MGNILTYGALYNWPAVNPGSVFSDWYLPSKGEWQKIYDELYLYGVGGILVANYWTSTEWITNYAYVFDTNLGMEEDNL